MTVLVKGEETVQLPTAEFDAAPGVAVHGVAVRGVAVHGPQVTGAAGRLWQALRAQQADRLSAKWSADPVEAAARRHAAASHGARRAAALDALALGMPELLSGLQLPAFETCWYQARAAAAAGDTPGLLGWLERLPPHGYAPRVALLLSRAPDLLRDQELAARAVAQLAAFTQADLDARALHAALAAPGTADVITPLVPFAVAAEGADGRLAECASGITELTCQSAAFPDELPVASALDAYLRAREGAEGTVKVDVLSQLPRPLLDELIDAGAVPRELAAQPGWPAAGAAYLRCRLTPGEATAADLEATGFTAELARRGYLEGDADGLDRLPADDEAVRHYRALAGWRSGIGQPGLDGLRPAARLILGQVAAMREAVAAGQDAVLPEELAADPTCWPLLWGSALQGALRLPGHLAQRHPRFADWLALCGIQRLLFQRRWEDAVAAGRALAARTPLEVTSDEALNMVAYGQLLLGEHEAALRTLDEALGGRHTTGLLVNASVIAAAAGSVRAIPYLARIAAAERDPAVRTGAYQRAVDVWAQDAASPAYPDSLRALVREALALPQPDELHRTLVRFADLHDAQWLADGAVRSEGPAQASWERYRRTWARAKTDGFTESLADVAKVLAGLVTSPSPPPWAEQELGVFVKQLDSAVHVDFGEAVDLVPTLDVLLDDGVLEPAYHLVFAAQAAAHLAVYLNDHDDCLSAAYERRRLFESAGKAGQSLAELPEGDRQWVSDELAKCAAITARSVALALMRQWDDATARWNDLVDRMRYADYDQARAITAAKRAIMADELEPMTARLRRYLVLLGDPPRSDLGREIKPLIADMANDWSAEIARLRPGV